MFMNSGLFYLKNVGETGRQFGRGIQFGYSEVIKIFNLGIQKS